MDPLGRRALDPVAPLPGADRAIASGVPPLADHYATGCDGDDALRVLDATLSVTETIPVGRRPCGVTVADSYLFVSNRDDDSVSMINGFTKVVVATIPVGDAPRGLLHGYSRVWVATAGGVAAIDVDLRVVATTIPVPGQPVALSFHAASIAVLAAGSNQLHLVDPTTQAILRSIPTGARPVLPSIDMDRVHTLTGPVSVEGAEPGDVLAVRLLELEPADWGWMALEPDFGILTGEFDSHGPLRSTGTRRG